MERNIIMAQTEYKKDEGVTTHEEEDGCGGCRNSAHSGACARCFNIKTGKHDNFSPEQDYWRRK